MKQAPAPPTPGAAAELPRRDGRTDRCHHRDRGGGGAAEGQTEIAPRIGRASLAQALFR
jgi:hypothetical protein